MIVQNGSRWAVVIEPGEAQFGRDSRPPMKAGLIRMTAVRQARQRVKTRAVPRVGRFLVYPRTEHVIDGRMLLPRDRFLRVLA